VKDSHSGLSILIAPGAMNTAICGLPYLRHRGVAPSFIGRGDRCRA